MKKVFILFPGLISECTNFCYWKNSCLFMSQSFKIITFREQKNMKPHFASRKSERVAFFTLWVQRWDHILQNDQSGSSTGGRRHRINMNAAPQLPGESPELLNGGAQSETGTTSNKWGVMEAKPGDARQQSDTGLPKQYRTLTWRESGCVSS